MDAPAGLNQDKALVSTVSQGDVTTLSSLATKNESDPDGLHQKDTHNPTDVDAHNHQSEPLSAVQMIHHSAGGIRGTLLPSWVKHLFPGYTHADEGVSQDDATNQASRRLPSRLRSCSEHIPSTV